MDTNTLFESCKDGNLPDLILEINKIENFDVNMLIDDDKNTLLHISCEYGHFIIVTYLVEILCVHTKININPKNIMGITPCMRACQFNHLDIVKFLLCDSKKHKHPHTY